VTRASSRIARAALLEHSTMAVSGRAILVDVESFCIRSDLPNAPQFARVVRAVVDQARAER